MKATSADRSYNGIVYHCCCDLWTSRGAESKRVTHKSHLSWKKIIASLDKTTVEKKEALLAKMIEEGWRVPVVFNEACQFQQRSNFAQQATFNTLFQPTQLGHLQPSLADQDYEQPALHPTEIVTPSGR